MNNNLVLIIIKTKLPEKNKMKITSSIISFFLVKLTNKNMKIYPNGVVIFDLVDIICIGLILGYSTGKIIKIINKYYSNKSEDRLVSELKRISPVKKLTKYEPIRVPVKYFPRGGQQPETWHKFKIFLKNKRLARLALYLLRVTEPLRKLKQVRAALVFLNLLLYQGFGIVFSLDGNMTSLRLILSTSSAYLIGALISLLSVPGGIVFIVGPIITLVSRYEYIPPEMVNECKLLCQAAKQYYNKKFLIEMKALNPELEMPVNLNVEQGPFECEGEGVLFQRYLENKEKLKKQVGNYNELKSTFPECNDENVEQLEKTVNQLHEKIAEKIQAKF